MKAQAKISQVVTFPAPIGGWNVNDPLPEMLPSDAVILDNFFCLPSQVQIRKGYTPWATGLAGNVQTIFNYAPQNGGEKIFAAANNNNVCQIYDVTTQGSPGVSVVGALNSAAFKTALFSNSGGVFLVCVNGADDLLLFDGATWWPVDQTTPTYAITGVATESLCDVISFKNRLWFVQQNTLSCWYLGVSSIAGAASPFNFGPLFKRGGHIVKIDTWTLDAGYGMDDYLVIFTSKGEVAVYRGTDPSQAATWALTGVFYIGAPTDKVGHTCKYGGDLLIINKDGIAQMSKSLMSSRVSTLLTLTQKIQPQLADDTTTYGGNPGWDMVLHPPENMLLVNVPLGLNKSYQYVMNTISGAWSRWTNIPAQCWAFAAETLLFGSAGAVYKMWDTQADNGAMITGTILPAFQKFGSEGQTKRWNMARVIFSYNSPVNVGVSMLVDFDQNTTLLSSPALIPANVGRWGASLWNGADWGGTLYTDRKWKSVSGFGYWGSLQMQFQTSASDVRVFSVDYNLEPGGVL
jgi:hypothetical protein